jgi:hypothetical protein
MKRAPWAPGEPAPAASAVVVERLSVARGGRPVLHELINAGSAHVRARLLGTLRAR